MKTIEKARGCGYKFVWVKNGRIFVRKAENENVLKICSEQELINIK